MAAKIKFKPQLNKAPLAKRGQSSFVELIEVLQKIDVKAPSAALNVTSIADNNGGRIEL
jgi:hypothetical protein